jgi:methylated-DNA-[protein]-cysteine S-methyltransferase
MTTQHTTIETPVGSLVLAGTRDALVRIVFANEAATLRPEELGWREDRTPFREAIRQLRAYFARELRAFDLPLDPRGTMFQCAVWEALRDIPYGATASYVEIARRIGRPAASRAVGAANGRNPLPVVIPCHRVIGASGDLTGYGGGLAIKRALLALEGAISLQTEETVSRPPQDDEPLGRIGGSPLPGSPLLFRSSGRTGSNGSAPAA